MPSSSAAPAATASTESDDAPAEEKPKEKTIFTVKLEKFDATAKAKIIREVKAMMPNMNLVEVSPAVATLKAIRLLGSVKEVLSDLCAAGLTICLYRRRSLSNRRLRC